MPELYSQEWLDQRSDEDVLQELAISLSKGRRSRDRGIARVAEGQARFADFVEKCDRYERRILNLLSHDIDWPGGAVCRRCGDKIDRHPQDAANAAAPRECPNAVGPDASLVTR
jgi:hypothetical protein